VQKTPSWWAEYKCPKCGYVSTVTDICRTCGRVMFATGYETRLIVTKRNKPKRNPFLAINETREKRRRMTKQSETYDHAIFISNSAKLQCEELGEPVPSWAWFGESRQGGEKNARC